MPNHYHLLAQLGEANLSRAVQWLNVSYSVWFNRRRQRVGYLFQGRFKSVVVDATGWGVALSAYIHLNPVRVARLALGKADRRRETAGLGPAPTASLVDERLKVLREFRWSSFDAFTRAGAAPKWLDVESVLKLAGGSPEKRRQNYRSYVENQIRSGLARSPWEELRDRALLGSEEWAAKIKKTVASTFKGAGTEAPRWARQALTWEDVLRAVEAARGLRWQDFRDRHGDHGRDLALYLARRATRLTAAELAKRVGLKSHAHVSMACKRYRSALKSDKAEGVLARRAAQMLHVTL